MQGEFERALAALTGLDCNPREHAHGQWSARCPAHDDRRPSLGFREGGRGQFVARCWTGCTFDAIREALGLTRERNDDTLEPSQPKRRESLPTDEQVQQWRSALLTNDKVLAAVRKHRGWSVRTLSGYEVGFDGSALVFPQRAVDGALANRIRYIPGPDSKTYALDGHARVLWPPPEQFPEGTTVWIVEGESDALSAYEMGLRGISVPGVNGWREQYAQRFTGRTVRVCLDCDPEGRRAGHRIVGELRALDIDARYIDLDPARSDKYDLTDFLLEAIAADGLTDARNLLHRLES